MRTTELEGEFRGIMKLKCRRAFGQHSTERLAAKNDMKQCLGCKLEGQALTVRMRLLFFLGRKKCESPEMVSQVTRRHKIIKQCIVCVFGVGTGAISQISRGHQ